MLQSACWRSRVKKHTQHFTCKNTQPLASSTSVTYPCREVFWWKRILNLHHIYVTPLLHETQVGISGALIQSLIWTHSGPKPAYLKTGFFLPTRFVQLSSALLMFPPCSQALLRSQHQALGVTCLIAGILPPQNPATSWRLAFCTLEMVTFHA